jgi:hypothetical protein
MDFNINYYNQELIDKKKMKVKRDKQDIDIEKKHYINMSKYL